MNWYIFYFIPSFISFKFSNPTSSINTGCDERIPKNEPIDYTLLNRLETNYIQLNQLKYLKDLNISPWLKLKEARQIYKSSCVKFKNWNEFEN